MVSEFQKCVCLCFTFRLRAHQREELVRCALECTGPSHSRSQKRLLSSEFHDFAFRLEGKSVVSLVSPKAFLAVVEFYPWRLGMVLFFFFQGT